MTRLNNFEDKALDMLIDFLADNPDFEDWDDLHNEVYNSDYTFIYYRDAVDELDEFGTWEAIEKVKEYEEFNFGLVYTDLSDPVKVANMLIYIIGEEIIYDLNIYDIVEALWDEDEEPEAITARIIEEVKKVA